MYGFAAGQEADSGSVFSKGGRTPTRIPQRRPRGMEGFDKKTAISGIVQNHAARRPNELGIHRHPGANPMTRSPLGVPPRLQTAAGGHPQKNYRTERRKGEADREHFRQGSISLS